MKLSRQNADIFVPDQSPLDKALERTTHLCIAAHQDDIEIFAYHGIATCYQKSDLWFSGVVVTDGGGSARTGLYAKYTDEQMKTVRREEQRKAATIGEYSVQIQLAHPSADVKDPKNPSVTTDLGYILRATKPEVVYLHNPADKHDTHVATLMRSLKALRALPPELRPKKVYGCEVWRNLDWLLDTDKQILDTGAHPDLAAALLNVFESQIAGGKRYDLATIGRRLANATFFESHATDQSNALTWAMDLTPLVADESLSVAQYTKSFIQRFQDDVEKRLLKF